MALLSQQLQRFLLTNSSSSSGFTASKGTIYKIKTKMNPCCSSVAINTASSSLAGVAGIRWGSVKFQGRREEMEDDVLVKSDGLSGFSFAAVFDGHAGFSSVEFLREELYNECASALLDGLVLSDRDFNTMKTALEKAFQKADAKLLDWLASMDKDDGSGSTATAIFIGNEMLVVSHVGDSNVVLSRNGKPEILTNPHRPYGRNKVSLQEIRRVREAGGWIVDGRICGDISISRAFGDIRFKTKKNEMLEKGVEEGRWTQKFISRIRFKDDLVTAVPDIYQVSLGPDAEFILLASDGLWDYMNSSEAVNLVRNQLQRHGDVQLACEALAQTALDRRSQDNISIVIADLGRTDWRNLPQRQNFAYELGQAFTTIAIVSMGIWMSYQFSF
uniref:protein-serine/threonine phosphatase n=1 Tax=Kalanchoe fedtschenkoi TaxID=63787 RepID=A0A7N0U211_KALFE